MSRSRAPLAIGAVAASGIGYYLYTSGGKPKVAEKQFESDMHRAAAKAKDVLPYRGAGAESEGKKIGQETGAKVDSAVSNAEREYSKAKSNAEAYAKEAKAEAMKAKSNAESYAKEAKAETLKKIDEFDRKVEVKTAEAKSGISSWFGFGGK